MDATRLPILTSALRRWSLGQEASAGGEDETVAGATILTFEALARMRKRCRTLNDAYDTAENKPEVRTGIQRTVGHLRELHAQLPPRLRKKSWILTIERYDGWTLEARSPKSKVA